MPEHLAILDCAGNERYVLPSGLTVLVRPMPGYAAAHAVVAARFGSIDVHFRLGGQELTLPAGVAHYLEHKMFEDQEGDAFAKFARTGANANAFTSFDRTCYYFTATSAVDESLDVLLGMLTHPYFTDETVAKEQGIIAQEIRMIEDEPDWRVYANLMECLYASHPVRVPVAGSVESIKAITPQVLYDCHKAFYTPANMVLVCVGDVEAAEVAALASEILPGESGPVIERDYGEEPLLPVGQEREMTMEISMPTFLGGWKCRPVQTGEDLLRRSIIGDMACDVLFGDSSPLYTSLYEEGAINGSLGGNFDVLPGAAYLYVGGDAKDPRDVFSRVAAEARRLGEEGIDESFYRQIRRASYGQMLRSLNSFENIAVSMAEGYFRGFDYYRFPEIFETVTKADVEAFLREELTEEHAALSIIWPCERQ